MDNYKYSKVFERLAVKIVEEYTQCKLDYKKTHITKATRDFGIDSVIFFSNRTVTVSTIEAKLRKCDYTLSLKDIASSILFFLVRKGDEHFIVSNVYITDGTIETLNLLCLQTQTKMQYIDGNKTKEALDSIIEKLKDPEEKELAELLIDNFSELKKPKKTKRNTITTIDKINLKNLELFESQKVVFDELMESIKERYKIINLHGEIGTGKSILLQQLNQALKKSIYNPIIIDAHINNTIDTFCYELTQKILGLDLKDIIYSFTDSDIKSIEKCLTDIENEKLSNIFHVFNKSEVSNEVATYLAKVYLNTIFKKCNRLNYIIEITNFSYTSQEVYNFMKDFAVDAPENVSVMFVFSKDISALHSDFSTRYKQLYNSLLKEINVENIKLDETCLYLKKQFPQIADKVVQQIYNFTKGNPLILNTAVKEIQKKVLINSNMVSTCLDSINIYHSRDFMHTIQKNKYALNFFFVLNLYSFSIQKTILNCIEKVKGVDEEEKKSFYSTFIENFQFVEETNFTYQLKNAYMFNYIEYYYEKNSECFYEYARSLKKIIFSSNALALTKIKVLFFCKETEIVDEYEKNKQSWMYKSNRTWKTSALKYVCNYFIQKENEDIEYSINSLKYYIEYLCTKQCYGDYEQNLLKKTQMQKEILEQNFINIPEEYNSTVANLLADFYIFQYYNYRQYSKFGEALQFLNDCVYNEWFLYTTDIKKIKIWRFIALLHKSYGRRECFNEILEKIVTTYGTNSYAKLIYWANKAALFYTKNSKIAAQYLEKCELDNFQSEYPEESELYLWVENDRGIVEFYNNNLSMAKELGQKVLFSSEKINYLENMARSHNLLGAIALIERNFDEAHIHFYKASMLCVDEKSEAFFHFAVNYLVISNKLNMPMIGLIMDYVKKQNERLFNIFEAEPLETCRWFVTLCAFNQYLLAQAPQLQKELEVLYGSVLLPTSSSKLAKYKIQEQLIVLF